jgi:hypothetical protein
MPQIETWSRLPRAVRDHLVERMRDRDIVLEDLNQLRLWMESKPDVPDGPWYKEFGDKHINSRRRDAGQLGDLWSWPTFIIGATAISATILHGIEGAVWAAAYRLLGALPDNKSAMLYSLNAMTSYGHANLYLAPGWEMIGALEALNGWILFGLTTAFLFNVIQKSWSLRFGASLFERKQSSVLVLSPHFQGATCRSFSSNLTIASVSCTQQSSIC